LFRVDVGVLVTALLQDGESFQLAFVVLNVVACSVKSQEHEDKENNQRNSRTDQTNHNAIATVTTTEEQKTNREEDEEPADKSQILLVSRGVQTCRERVEADLSGEASVLAVQIPVDGRSSPRAVFILGLERLLRDVEPGMRRVQDDGEHAVF